MLLAVCLLEAAGVSLILLALMLDGLDRPWR